jgi:hypothetical protein
MDTNINTSKIGKDKNAEISDKNFLRSFADLNWSGRATVSSLLNDTLHKKTKAAHEGLTAYCMQMLENYSYLSECIVMLLYALRERKNTHKSLLAIYKGIYLKEKRKERFNTKNIFNFIDMLKKPEDFWDFFDLPTTADFEPDEENKELCKLIEEHGSIEKVQKNYREITEQVINAIESFLEHRIHSSLGRIANKCKHGYQVFKNDDPDSIYIMAVLKDSHKGSSSCKVTRIECSKELADSINCQTIAISEIISRFMDFVVCVY